MNPIETTLLNLRRIPKWRPTLCLAAGLNWWRYRELALVADRNKGYIQRILSIAGLVQLRGGARHSLSFAGRYFFGSLLREGQVTSQDESVALIDCVEHAIPTGKRYRMIFNLDGTPTTAWGYPGL